jgi:hypothetical protein
MVGGAAGRRDVQHDDGNLHGSEHDHDGKDGYRNGDLYAGWSNGHGDDHATAAGDFE